MPKHDVGSTTPILLVWFLVRLPTLAKICLNCIVTLLFYAESAHYLGELLIDRMKYYGFFVQRKRRMIRLKRELGGTTTSSLSACHHPTEEGIGTSQLERDAYQLIHTLHIKEFKESHAPVFTSEETPLASD